MKTPDEIIQGWNANLQPHACIAALDAAGYVIVPKEPTSKMLRHKTWSGIHMADIWHFMIAAAQNAENPPPVK